LYRLAYPSFEVIVCDNASTDDSISMIGRWAKGAIHAMTRSSDPRIRSLTDPPVQKPIAVSQIDEREMSSPYRSSDSSLTILRMARNRGYASGNNAGIRLAQSRGDGEMFWILNNDTVVDPEALARLVERVSTDPEIGLCGSLLLFYDNPDKVQAAGGARYRPVTAIPKILGAGKSRDAIPPVEAIERQMSYVVGASMLATASFVRDVGLMREDYFLYYEELDWVMRSGGRFRLAFAPGSIVYHKEGASAGSSSDWRTRSEISDLCAIRNRLLITRRFFWPYYPVVFATVLGVMLRRLWRRQPDRAGQVLRMLLGPESYRLPRRDPHAWPEKSR
jgi:GT2 family glycosyltransferase